MDFVYYLDTQHATSAVQLVVSNKLMVNTFQTQEGHELGRNAII